MWHAVDPISGVDKALRNTSISLLIQFLFIPKRVTSVIQQLGLYQSQWSFADDNPQNRNDYEKRKQLKRIFRF